MVQTRITSDARSSGQYSIIVNETSDISRTEQVSLCLGYIFKGETRETFVGFFTTASTEGEVLYELVKTSVTKLDLQLIENFLDVDHCILEREVQEMTIAMDIHAKRRTFFHTFSFIHFHTTSCSSQAHRELPFRLMQS